MTSSNGLPSQGPTAPILYRFLRGLVRVGLKFYFSRLRLLRAEGFPNFGAIILVIGRPASFLEALVLVAAVERQVHCLLSRRLLEGPARKLLARGLGMIIDDAQGAHELSRINAACDALTKGEAVVVFSEKPAPKTGEAGAALTATTLALEAESRHLGAPGPGIFPAHMFMPDPRSHSKEALIYLHAPVPPKKDLAARGHQVSDRAGTLATVIGERLREKVFSIQPNELQHFLSDLEEVLRADLEENWASRPNWKQTVEGFGLSGFVAEWAARLNELNPERLVVLRESLCACREAQRLWSLRQLELESARANPIWRRWRVPLLVLRVSREAKRLRRTRREFLEELNRSIYADAEAEATRPDARASGLAGIPGPSNV